MSSVVALPPHGMHIHINNEFRNENEEAISFRSPPMASNTEAGSYLLQLKQVITQNMFPNIEEGVSNTLIFTLNNVERTIVLDPGYYDVESLVVAINAVFLPLALELEYDYDLRKLVLNIEPSSVFQWVSPNIAKGQGSRKSSFDRLLSMMGFWENRNTTYVGPLALRATNPINLFSRLCMNIYLDRNLSVTGSNYNNPQILCTIPITVPFGEPIFYEPIQPRTFVMSAYDMDTIQIQACDEYGNRIKAPENTTMQLSWTMIPQGRSFD